MMEINPNEELPMNAREQGLEMECIYCKHVYPELKKEECPFCKGKGLVFQPAQMMEKRLSNVKIFRDLKDWLNFVMEENLLAEYQDENDIVKQDQAKVAKRTAINLVKRMIIYNFNLKEAIIEFIHDLDRNYNLEKTNF
ncbi:MAG: hypothetical protein ACTSRW_05040 [Candidatus Helarchaeota archaeon]